VAQVIQLENGDLALDLDPARGMLTTSWRWRDAELLAPARARREEIVKVDTVRGMALLAPWANRLPGDRYDVGARTVDLGSLPIERDEVGRPLHGTLTGRGGWAVLEQRADVAIAGLQLDDDPLTAAAFPFAARIQVEWRLGVDALEVTTTLFSTGDDVVPACFGWHPYLVLPDADRAACTVTVPGRGVIVPGEDTVDDLVPLGTDREASVTGARRTVSLTLGPGYEALQVWMPVGPTMGSRQTNGSPTGALTTGAHPVARPGAPYRASFRLDVRGSD
jgi:galactose mutarotase-like enzyme